MKNKLKTDLIISLIIGFFSAIFLYTIFTLRKVNLSFGTLYFKNWQIIIFLPILFVFSFWIASFISKKIRIFYQFVKFGYTGFLNTTIDFGVLNILIYIFKIYSGFAVVIMNTISFSLAVTNSYFFNKYWTFESKRKMATREYFQFVIVSIIGLLINDGIVYIVTTFITPFIGISPVLWVNIAKALAIVIQLIWNFIGYKLIVFKQKI